MTYAFRSIRFNTLNGPALRACDFLIVLEGNCLARLHGHAIFGVVSDTGTGTTRRIPVSGECPLLLFSFFFFFFFFLTHVDVAPTRLRRGSDVSDTPAVKKKKKISAYFGSSRLFRPILAEMKISSDTRF